MVTFYIGDCPICKTYGRLEIDVDSATNEYFVMCEECLAEWETPQDAIRNIGGRRDNRHSQVRSATFDEIQSLGWDKFVVSSEGI